MTDATMSPNQPYLLRAIYEWILDNHCTPHLLVDVSDARVKVPREHVRDGQIVLNINPGAVGQFHWDNDHIEFSARFGGVSRNLWIPMTAVKAIYARENGQGMAFSEVAPDSAIDEDVVEQGDEQAPENTSAPAITSSSAAVTDPDGDDPSPPGGGRPRLKIVK